MGPGLNSFPEERLLAAIWPENTVFWNQPPTSGSEAYRDLVGYTLEKLDDLAQKEKINLIGHSFGGHLLRECLTNRPEKVNSVTLISTGHDPITGFHRLLEKLLADNETPLIAKEKVTELVLKYPNLNDAPLLELVQAIVQDPEFMRLYWPNFSEYLKFKTINELAPAFHFQTFIDVLNDFSRNASSIPTRIEWKGDAELILGENDPLINTDRTESYWKTCIQDLHVTKVPNSGHFPHLENMFRSYSIDGKQNNRG
jgi:pimeloyl-ACP methyl ester carboxylesterase